MPSGPIQVIPAGLLGFLNLKNNGKNPQLLMDEVRPMFDWMQWSFQTEAQLQSPATVTTLTAIGFTNLGLTVPSNEWWYVTWLNAVFSTDVGDATIAAVLWQQGFTAPGVSNRNRVTEYVNIGASDSYFVAARDFWLPPNATIVAHVRPGSAFAGSNTVTTRMMASRLRI